MKLDYNAGRANIRLIILVFAVLSLIAVALFYFQPTSGGITFTDSTGKPLRGVIESSTAWITGVHEENVNFVSWSYSPNKRIYFNALDTKNLSVNLRISGSSPDAKVILENYGVNQRGSVNAPVPGTPVKYVEISAMGVSFAEAEISIQYTDAEVKGLDVNNLTIYRYDNAAQTWNRLDTRIDEANKLLSATVNSLSIFAVASRGVPQAIEVHDAGKIPVISDIKSFDEAKNVKIEAKTSTLPEVYVSDRGELEVDALASKNVAVKLKVNTASRGEIILDDYGKRNPVSVRLPGKVVKFVEIGANNISFSSANITIRYSDAELNGGSENYLTIYHWNGASWDALPTIIDTMNRTLSATTTSLSPFGVVTNVIYYMENNQTIQSVGADGNTNPSLSGTTITTIPYLNLLNSTVPGAQNSIAYKVAKSTTYEIFRFYRSSNYSVDTRISATTSGIIEWAGTGGPTTSDTVNVSLIDYNPTNGAKTVIGYNNSISIPSSTPNNYSFTIPNPQYTVPAGHLLMFRINTTAGTWSGGQTKSVSLYFNDASSYISVTETALVGAISGYVINASSGSSLPGATVQINASLPPTTTNATGAYNFTGLPNGTYMINASLAGYATNSTNVTISGADVTNANISLSPIAGIAGVNLTNISALSSTTQAGTNATYTLNLTNNGTATDIYTISVSNPDSASTAATNITSVTLNAGASKIFTLNVTNTAAGTFRANVTAISGNDPIKFGYINTTTTVIVAGVNLTNISALSSTTLAGTNSTYTLNLTNNGTATDTYAITVSNTDSASTAATNITSVVLNAGASKIFTLNVTNTAAGTFRANVTATSGNDLTKFGYINTTTTVTAIRAVSLTNISALSSTTTAGTNATYVLNLTNNGTDADSYTLTISPNSASTASLNITSPVFLNAGATMIFALNVTNTSSGIFYVNITATSVNDSSKFMYVNTTTTVTAIRAVSLTNISALSSTTTAGTNATYVLNLTNNGTDADSYTLVVSNPNNALIAALNISSPVFLNSGASKILALNVTNTSSGIFYVNITATSVNESSKFMYVNTTTTVIVAGVNLTNISALSSTTLAGTNSTYTLNLTNNGTATDTYTITVSNPDSASTAATNITSVALNAGASKIFTLNVTNTAAGTFRANVTATSGNDPTKFGYINTTTTVIVAGVNLTNISALSSTTLAGTNSTYTLNLTNNGTTTDTYTITVSNPDSASTAATNITSVTLNAGASKIFTLNVTNTAAGTFRANVTAASGNDPTKFGYINTTTTVTAIRAVSLTNISALSSTTTAGTNATYVLNLTNNGTDADSYNLVFSNPDGASIVGLNLTSPVSLNAGASKIFSLNVTNSASGTFRVNVTATSVNDSSKFMYINTTTTVNPAPTFIPPAPVNLASTQGNFWINYTWQAGAGNKTDSYNVSVNGIWTNGTTSTYSNNSAGAHGWSNITLFAYNSSGIGTSSLTSASSNTQVANNVPVQSSIGNKAVDVGNLLTFTVSATDADLDPITYGTNATKGTLNPATGVYSWTPDSGDVGTYVWYFNSSDGYGGVANETITVTVSSAPTYIPPAPVNLANTQGNFWINYTWQGGAGNKTDSYNVSVNGIWTNGTTSTYSNNSAGAHGWSNITVFAYNSSGIGTSSLTSASSNTQVANNVPVQSPIGNKAVDMGNLLTFTVSATDADLDPITYGTNATKGTLNPTTGVYSWTPGISDVGTYVWYFNSSDGYGVFGNETITVTVNAIPFYSLSGYVIDKSSGLSLNGAAVQTNTSQTTTTNTTGFYNFSLSNGTYIITASMTGYVANSTTITINAADVTNANISLSPGFTAFKIMTPLHHSSNISNGSVWGSYWTNTTPLTACLYCHNDTKHNATPLGRILFWAPNYSMYSSIGTNTSCANCHYKGENNYTQMNSTFVSSGLPVPPEITNGTNWNGISSNYYNHSFSSYTDQDCKACHGSLLSASANMSEFLHNVAIGVAGGSNCTYCHDIGGTATGKLVNISAMNDSLAVHKNLNSNATTLLPPENKKCWACHGNGSEPGGSHPTNYKAPYRCPDCHVPATGQNLNYTPNSTLLNVSQHYWNGTNITTSNVTSCYACHNRTEMMIPAYDPDSGTGAVYGGANGGNNSTSHYGKKRTDLAAWNSSINNTYCNYCHNTTVNNATFYVRDFNNTIVNHTSRATTPLCSNCHNTGRIHNSTLAKPVSNDTLCKTCHGTGGSAATNNKSEHKNLYCTECHANSTAGTLAGKDIHGIKYLLQNNTFSTSNSSAVNCTTCHQTSSVDSSIVGFAPPKIANPLRHSDNPSNGSLWNGTQPGYWINTTLQTACIYCHNDTKHNATPLGRILQWSLNYTMYLNISSNFTCSDCHYRSDSNYTQMNSTFASAVLTIPPEITNVTNWNGVSSNYYNHTLSAYDDQTCKTCHGSQLSSTTNMSEFLHSVAKGGDCKSCHFNYTFMNSSGKPARYVNSTMFNNSPHGSLRCEDCHTKGHNNIGARKACEDCHAVQQDPINEKDRHNITRTPSTYTSNGVSVVNITTCTTCHNETLYSNATSNYGYGKTYDCDYCHTYPDKTYS